MVALFACGDNTAGPPDAPPRPACHDNKDNDDDGLTDYPEDPGCVDLNADREDTPLRPQCSDNRDNDGDGLKDFPDDPGCFNELSASEQDDCPDGPFCPQCGNKRDDDGNGPQDFPADPGCKSAADNLEYTESPQACGAGLTIKQLPPSGTDTGMLDGMSVSNLPTTCSSVTGVPAVAYVMVLSRQRIVEITTGGSLVDTVLDLRSSPCEDVAAELDCHDDVSSTDKSSRILRSLDPGVYYIIVQGKTASATGPYLLNVRRFNSQGESCSLPNDCGPGLVCRIPLGGTAKICTRPVCSDGLDDDGDGKLDFPNDPGCAFEADPDESDDCPSGTNCPACADGVDNDGDGRTDYPFDDSCKVAGDASEACVTSEKPIGVIVGPTTSGTTVGAVNDYDPSCNNAAGMGPDVMYRVDLPAMTSLSVNISPASGFDPVHALHDSTCGATALTCSSGNNMTVTNLAAGTYYVIVDANLNTSGAFTLTTSGTIAPGGSCEGPLFDSGAIMCPGSLVCDGPVGARTCRTQCTDGLDNNGDGRADYPEDPGCLGPGDNAEETVCPGPSCPACSDGLDNDGDTLADFPEDPTCVAASGPSELCFTSEKVNPITEAVTTGTTSGAVNDYDPTCNAATGVAPDVFYQLDLPRMATLTLNVTGFDTVTTVLDATCGGTPVLCSDPPSATLTNVAAGTYYVGIEGKSGTTSGSFTLTTSGQVAPGESCEGALFQSGALTCTSGHACQGMPGARTCAPAACNDGVDNNGDGKIDFPNDPSCVTINDGTEETVCPGVECPECGDGIDNDGDSKTDYPSDTSCKLSAGLIEGCNAEKNPIVRITASQTLDTLVGATHEHQPSCVTGMNGADKLFTIQLPRMATLTIDTDGSGVTDTVLSLLDRTCNEPAIACDDDSGTGSRSLITRTNLPAGVYIIAVDAYSSSTTLNTITLNVTGAIASGESCEGELFQSGVISCPSGFSCRGPVGARTCLTDCNDGVDNNGDGKIDYPFDPGCASPIDFVEDTVCPGATCPVCSNMMDDDGDMLADWPADFGCQAASGTTEAFCTVDPDFRGPITMPVTLGTLAPPAANHGNPVCQANSGNDVVYSLTAPVAADWVISTEGSMIADTVLSLYEASCTMPPLACDDDSGTGPLSQISMSLPAGNYAIQIDSYTLTANNGPFQLNVQGTALPGSDCTSPLFSSGVLVCPAGQTCGGLGVCE